MITLIKNKNSQEWENLNHQSFWYGFYEVKKDLMEFAIESDYVTLVADILGDLKKAAEGLYSSDYRSEDFLSLHPYQGVLDELQALALPGGDLEDNPEAFRALGAILSHLPGTMPGWWSSVWERNALLAEERLEEENPGPTGIFSEDYESDDSSAAV
jgi:hypothetical protein